jgi:hypothetical protein
MTMVAKAFEIQYDGELKLPSHYLVSHKISIEHQVTKKKNYSSSEKIAIFINGSEAIRTIKMSLLHGLQLVYLLNKVDLFIK